MSYKPKKTSTKNTIAFALAATVLPSIGMAADEPTQTSDAPFADTVCDTLSQDSKIDLMCDSSFPPSRGSYLKLMKVAKTAHLYFRKENPDAKKTTCHFEMQGSNVLESECDHVKTDNEMPESFKNYIAKQDLKRSF